MNEDSGWSGDYPPDGAATPLEQAPLEHTPQAEQPSTVSPAGAGGGGQRGWVPWAVVAGVLVVAVVLAVAFGSTTTPKVIGLTLTQAKSDLDAAGLSAGAISEEPTLAVKPGTVTSQSPEPDERSRKGATVDLVVAAAVTATVPDVVGMTESKAEAELAAAGLRVGSVTGSYSSDTKAGVVLKQAPESGTGSTVGSAVALDVSLGPETSGVPNVVGLTASDAEAVLSAAGFAMKETSATSAEAKPGVVIRQTPTPGTVAEKGSFVTVTVSSGPPAATTPPPTTPSQPEPPSGGQATPQPKPSPEAVDVPDLLGMRVLEAIRALRDAELEVDITWGPTSEDFLRVIEQEPSAGTSVAPGSRVEVTLGLPEFLFGTAERPEDSPPTTGTPEVTTLPAPSGGATEGTGVTGAP